MAIFPDTSALTDVQTAFLERLKLGVVAVGKDALSLTSILASIEIALFGLWWALSGSDIAATAFRKILLIGFIMFVITNYADLIPQVSEGFTYTAERAAGARAASINDPSAIIDAAFTATLPAMELGRKLKWSLRSLIDGLIILICVLGIFLAYCSLAFQIFITRIEFGLVSTLGLILIPFGVLKPTAFLAEKTFGAILGFGVKLMVLAFILAITWPTLSKWALPANPDWGQLLCMLAATLAIAVLSFHAPSVVSGMLWGTPSLSSGHVMSSAQAMTRPLSMAVGAIAATGAAGAVLGGIKGVFSSKGEGARSSSSNRETGQNPAGATRTGSSQDRQEGSSARDSSNSGGSHNTGSDDRQGAASDTTQQGNAGAGEQTSASTGTSQADGPAAAQFGASAGSSAARDSGNSNNSGSSGGISGAHASERQEFRPYSGNKDTQEEESTASPLRSQVNSRVAQEWQSENSQENLATGNVSQGEIQTKQQNTPPNLLKKNDNDFGAKE